MEWVERVTGERVIASRTLHGGSTSDLRAVTLASGRTLALRHVLDADYLAEEPDVVAHEAAALDLLAGSGLPVPRLVAHTATMLLMTLLPGAPDLRSPHVADTVALAARLHEIAAPQGFWRFQRYSRDVALEPPAWAADPGPWRAAIALAEGPVPDYEPVLVHRDLHPLNLLWSAGACTGLVDWASCCMGPAAIDATHWRANAAMLWGAEAADAWPGDPYWDAVSVTDFLPDVPEMPPWHAHGRTDLTVPLVRERLDAHLARALRG